MVEKIVDVHLHPFELITDDHLLTEMDKAGVDVSVLLALDVDPSTYPKVKRTWRRR